MTAAGGVLALGAGARRLPNSEPLQASGSIVYTWHGDAAHGCSAALCSVSGALVISHFASPSLEGGALNALAQATVRVNDGSGECADTFSEGPFLVLQRQAGGTFRAALAPNSVSGRCAEPLSQELAAVSLPVKLTGPRRRPTFDLRSVKSFAAGPFAATLDSTLVLRPAPPQGGGPAFSITSSSGSSSGSSRSAKVMAEFVTVVFRVRVAPSALQYTLSGESGPFCQILDSCGTSGSLSLSLSGSALKLVLNVVRRVHHRVSSRQALADFRRGVFPFTFPGSVDLDSQTHEQLTRAGAQACQDGTRGQLALTLGSFTPLGPPAKTGGTVPVELLSANQPNDVLRTHCPGPLDSDVLPSSTSQVYAHGSISASELLAAHLEISLSDPGTFSGPGYTGTRTGKLGFELTRASLHAGTEGGS